MFVCCFSRRRRNTRRPCWTAASLTELTASAALSIALFDGEPTVAPFFSAMVFLLFSFLSVFFYFFFSFCFFSRFDFSFGKGLFNFCFYCFVLFQFCIVLSCTAFLWFSLFLFFMSFPIRIIYLYLCVFPSPWLFVSFIDWT